MAWTDDIEELINKVQEKGEARIHEEDEGGVLSIDQQVEAREEISAICGRLWNFATPAAGSCRVIKDKLVNAGAALRQHINDNIEDARNTLTNWHDSVGNPVQDYLGQCATAIVWQYDFLHTLHGLAHVQHELIMETRKDVNATIEDLADALKHTPIESPSGPDVGFGLFGKLSTFGAAIFTPLPGDEVAAGFAMAQTVTGALETFVNAQGGSSPTRVRRGNVVEILRSARRRLDELAETAKVAEDGVYTGIDEAWKFIQVSDNALALSPPRPQPDWSRIDPAEVRAIDPVGIRQAATEQIPPVAEDYREAAILVASVAPNEGNAFYSDGLDIFSLYLPWQGLRGELQRILDKMATELEEIAGILQQVADNFLALQDAQQQALLNIERRLDEVREPTPVEDRSEPSAQAPDVERASRFRDALEG